MARSRKVEFAVEQETTPGTAETPVLADVLVPLRSGYTTNPQHEPIDLEELRAVSSSAPAIIARKTVVFTITYILRGPGDLVTAPAIAPLIEACMFDGAAAKTIDIGAITGGPYVAGEIVTGGTSTATGMVLQQTANGASSLPYLPLTDTMQSGETLTGGTSGATSTSSGTPDDGGYAFRPADWDSVAAGHHATCQFLRDGLELTGRGCLSDLQLEFANGGPCIVTQNISGALASISDQALFGVTVFPEASVVVPKFLSSSLYLDSETPRFRSVTINWPTNPQMVEDANSSASDGILYFDHDRELPTISLEFDQVAVATYDYFSKIAAGTVIRFELTHGSAAGAKWTLAAPAAQFRSLGIGSEEPDRATFVAELGLTGSNNEELLIWQH